LIWRILAGRGTADDHAILGTMHQIKI